MQRLVFISGILVFLYTNQFAQDNEIKAYLAEADRLAKNGQFDQAIENINKALEIAPLHLESLEKKVSFYLNADKTKQIQKEIEDEIAKSPQIPEYHYLLAIIHLYKEKPKNAVESLDNAIYYKMPEKYMSKIFLNRGMAYYNLGEFDKAEEDFQDAISRNPKYAAAYHSYGMLQYELRKYDEAKKLFLEALKYENQDPLIYYNLAMCYMRLNDMENACFNFGKACSSLNYKNACKVFFLECTK